MKRREDEKRKNEKNQKRKIIIFVIKKTERITRTMKNKVIFFFVMPMMVFVGCQNSIVWQQTKDIAGEGWHKDSIVSLTFPPQPQEKKYDIFFLIRNDNNYPYANLFLIAEIKHKDKSFIDTLEYEMADEKGRWLGSGIWDLKESKLVFKKQYRVDKKTPLNIKLQQAVRKTGQVDGDSILPGIKTVGIIIEEHQE
jgi:gliding motility-associated lipoprotein GldH